MIRTILHLAALALAVFAPASIAAQTDQEPLKVAIIDSGVARADHLASMLSSSWDLRSDDRKGRNRGYNSQHGTYVAGIIAARVTRPVVFTSYRVDISCRRDQPCRLDSSAIAVAIRYAIRDGMDLIQISIDGKLGDNTVEAIARAANSGIQVVLSAGNDGHRSETADAASGLGPNVHVVGALDRNGNRADFTSYSRRDDVVLVMRQGVNVEVRDSAGRMARVTGTSFAAPIYAAELLEAMPRHSNTEIAAAN